MAEYEAIQTEFKSAVNELRNVIAKTESKDEQVQILAVQNPLHLLELTLKRGFQ